MPRVMGLRASRERAEQVWLAREVGRQPWSKMRDQFGFTSVGSAQCAHASYVKRHPKPDPAAVFLGIVERNRTAGGVALSELTQAVKEGDHKAAAALIGTIQRLDAELAKLFGLYAPERVDVNVATTATAILDRAEAELVALAAAQPLPSPGRPAALPVLDAEVVP